MKIRFAFHPFSFAAYAVLGVYQANANEVPPEQIIRPLVVILAMTALIYYGLYRYFQNMHRAALLATLWVIWAIYFGHAYRLADTYRFYRSLPDLRLVVLIIWTILLGVFALPKIWKALSVPTLLTAALNTTSAVVLVLPVFVVVTVMQETIQQRNIVKQRQADSSLMIGSATEQDPDIYYLIVDGYGRQDTLKSYLHYDNQAFVDHLREKGFYVADASQSNYMMTRLSVSSSLNFEYINYLENDLAESDNHGLYTNLINHSLARRLLEERGYQFINIESATLFMRIRDADIYLAPPFSRLNEFESLLLTTSIADVLVERLFPNIPLVNYATHRKYIEYQFKTLAEIPELPGKKFVFVHIMAPHPPFVFDQDGHPAQSNFPYSTGDANGFFGTEQEYLDGYGGELTYLNKLLEQALEEILERSTTPPIIILQGDHGPGVHTSFLSLEATCLEERFSILNAYYFPDGDYAFLAEDISPINSFRVVLNQYLGADLPFLENRNYYVTGPHPYQYVDVTGQTNQACEIK